MNCFSTWIFLASTTCILLSPTLKAEAPVESLALTCQALWEVARDHSRLSDEQLLAKVSEIDLRDGVADGKMGSGTEPCSKCGRTISKRHMSCMYCGEQIVKQHTFQP